MAERVRQCAALAPLLALALATVESVVVFVCIAQYPLVASWLLTLHSTLVFAKLSALALHATSLVVALLLLRR